MRSGRARARRTDLLPHEAAKREEDFDVVNDRLQSATVLRRVTLFRRIDDDDARLSTLCDGAKH